MPKGKCWQNGRGVCAISWKLRQTWINEMCLLKRWLNGVCSIKISYSQIVQSCALLRKTGNPVDILNYAKSDLNTSLNKVKSLKNWSGELSNAAVSSPITDNPIPSTVSWTTMRRLYFQISITVAPEEKSETSYLSPFSMTKLIICSFTLNSR